MRQFAAKDREAESFEPWEKPKNFERNIVLGTSSPPSRAHGRAPVIPSRWKPSGQQSVGSGAIEQTFYTARINSESMQRFNGESRAYRERRLQQRRLPRKVTRVDTIESTR
jgi:hypothetical protein